MNNDTDGAEIELRRCRAYVKVPEVFEINWRILWRELVREMDRDPNGRRPHRGLREQSDASRARPPQAARPNRPC